LEEYEERERENEIKELITNMLDIIEKNNINESKI
jgi:hypothetical protein